MSYDDLEEARARCTEKDATKEAKDKAKRRRKRKDAVLESEEPKIKVLKKSKTQTTEGEQAVDSEPTPESRAVPMARMY
jgi:hypothetical protein